MNLNEELKIEYARLLRHISDLRHQWSEHITRDLSACLRNWVQLSGAIDKSKLDLSFTHYKKTKELKNMERPGSKSSVFPDALRHKKMSVMSFAVHNRVVTGDEMKKSVDSQRPSPAKEMTMLFSAWLGVETYELKIIDGGEPRRMGIARKIFIERCANVLGGVHPLNSHDVSDQEEEYKEIDRYIISLMREEIGGVPMPYAQLMSYAETIVKAFEPHLT